MDGKKSKMKLGTAFVRIAIVILGIPSLAYAVTFNDGGTHIIDATNSYPLDPVIVEDSPTGQPTTLLINEGGDIGSISGDGLTANGSSAVTMNGGAVFGSIMAYGSTQVTINFGSVRGDLNATEDTSVQIVGGTVDGEIVGTDSASILIQGGSELRVRTVAGSAASVRVEGGVFREYTNSINVPNGRLSLTGGTSLNSVGGRAQNDISLGASCEPLANYVSSINGGDFARAGDFYGKSTVSLGCGSTLEFGSGELDIIQMAYDARLFLSGDARFSRIETAWDFTGLIHISGGILEACWGYFCALPSFFSGTSEVYVSGGILRSMDAPHLAFEFLANSKIIVSGGELIGSYSFSDDASMVFSGGRVEGQLMFKGSSTGAISGGVFEGGLQVQDGARLSIYGGGGSASVLVLSQGLLELVGGSFDRPLGFVEGTSGSLSGILADGNPISIDFQKSGTASILLRAPATPTTSDLSASFVSPPTTVDTHGNVNLTFSVTNNGPDPADNVQVTFDAPATAINPTITTGTWSQSGSTFTSDLGTLASGATASFELTYSVGGDAGILDHQVSVLSKMFDPISIDPDEINNSASTTITIQCGTSAVYGQNPDTSAWVGFPGSCDVPAGWNVSLTAPAGFVGVGYNDGYSDGAASVDTQFYYDNGYTDGFASVDTQSFFDSGFSTGVSSVDTQSFYDDGFSSGAASRDPEITTLKEDLAICLPEPGASQLLISGILGLVGLSRVRSRSFA